MIEIRRRISTPFSGVSGMPGDRRRARGRRDERAERPHGRGLPGAVRPEETEHLAVADLKGDVLERDPVTEALAQTVDGQRRSAARSRPDAAGHVTDPKSRNAHLARGPQARPARSTATGASAGDVVRRLSFLMSHLIR